MGKMDYDLEAVFWKEKGIEYRNATKLIFDSGNQGCGIVIMLNPGGCLPVGGKEEVKEISVKFSTKDGNLKKDPTQGLVVSCVKYFYGEIKIPDCVFIVNLSDKVEVDSNKLLEGDFRKKDHNTIMEEIGILAKKNQIKWIWVAFGKISKDEDKKYLDDLKCNVIKELNRFGGKVVGESAYYCHPRYVNCNKDLKDNLKKEIELKLHNS